MSTIPDRIEIILREGEFVERTVSERGLGKQEEVLAHLFDSNPVEVPNMGLTPEGRRLGMVVLNDRAMVVTPLTKLPFSTTFERDEDGYRPTFLKTPVLGQPVIKGEIDTMSFFDTDVALGLLLYKASPVNGRTCWRVKTAIMGLMLNGEAYHFSYPNHFRDGRVCMGKTWDFDPNLAMPAESTVHQLVDRHVRWFNESTMNTDLNNDATYRLYRRNPDGEWIKPSKAIIDGSIEIMSNTTSNLLVAAYKNLKGHYYAA